MGRSIDRVLRGALAEMRAGNKRRDRRTAEFVRRLLARLNEEPDVVGARLDCRVPSGRVFLILDGRGDGHAYRVSVQETNLVRQGDGTWRWFEQAKR